MTRSCVGWSLQPRAGCVRIICDTAVAIASWPTNSPTGSSLPELLYEISTRPASVNNAATVAPSRASTPRTYFASTCCTPRSSLIVFSPVLFTLGACHPQRPLPAALNLYLSLKHIGAYYAIMIGTDRYGRGDFPS